MAIDRVWLVLRDPASHGRDSIDPAGESIARTRGRARGAAASSVLARATGRASDPAAAIDPAVEADRGAVIDLADLVEVATATVFPAVA